MLYSSNFTPKIKNKEVECTMLWFSNDFAICTGDEDSLKKLSKNLGHIFDTSICGNVITLSVRDQKRLHNIKYLHTPLQSFGKNKNTQDMLGAVYKYITPDRVGKIKTHPILKLIDDSGDFKYATITHAKNVLVPQIKYGKGFNEYSKFIPVSNINESSIIKIQPQHIDTVTLRTIHLKIYASIYNSSKLTVTDHKIYNGYTVQDFYRMPKTKVIGLANNPIIWSVLGISDIKKYFFNPNALDLQAYMQDTNTNNIVKVYDALKEQNALNALDSVVATHWNAFIKQTAIEDYKPTDTLFNFFSL